MREALTARGPGDAWPHREGKESYTVGTGEPLRLLA